VDAPYEVPDLREGAPGLAVGLLDQPAHRFGVFIQLLLRHPQVHRQRDETLLSAVVQVAL
jgi:hypothetical protein